MRGKRKLSLASSWRSTQEEGLAHNWVLSRDESLSLHHDLQPLSGENLTTLSMPRTVFLHDLFAHKEIDICGHIYHLFVKCIKKRNSRLTLPFPSLVMSLISRARVKIPSGLSVMQREEPISEQTIIQSKAHIPDPSTSTSQIPRDEVAKEGCNFDEEI